MPRLVPIEIPPGISRNGTQYQTPGRWYDCNQVRWFDGIQQPIGGWNHMHTVAFDTKCRTLHPWRSNGGGKWLGLGFSNGLYVTRGTDTFYDITPVRETATLTDPFATTISSTTVTVTDTSHGAAVGDRVTFSGATAVGGITIDGKYTIVSVPTADTYTITHTSAATSTVASGGGTVTAEYDMSAGDDDPVEFRGYGAGLYGMGTYGTPRDEGNYLPLSIWHLDNWGEYLVGCMRGEGGIYEWQLDTSVDAAAIVNAPTGCLGLVVSEQRHLIALGPDGNIRKVQWSHKENNTVWTPSDTNEAGSFELQTSGVIQRGVRVRGEVLILTNVDAHVLKYIGYPFIFSRDRVGNDCGLVGPNAVIAAESFAAWMSERAFWAYEGSGVRPLPCDVSDYVFSDFNFAHREKVVAGHNGEFGEVWWFYPSGTATENDRYVVWNYRENHWAIGALDRTAWTDRGVFNLPFAMGTDNILYTQEDGLLADGASRIADVFAETGALEIDDGNNVFGVHQIIPDEKISGQLALTFFTRFTPNGDDYEHGPYTVREDGYTDCRFSGRQVVMRVEPTVDEDWRLGRLRLSVTRNGRR